MKKVLMVLMCVFVLGGIGVFVQENTVLAADVLGDVDSSGKVDLQDAKEILKCALGIVQTDSNKKYTADVNNDGKVTLQDAKLVLKKALGIINNYDDVTVEKVTISKSSATLKIGESLTLTANAYPSNAVNKKITWSSSNSKVANVSNGVVKAVGSGTATITASAGGYSAKCVITVKNYNTSSSNDYKYAKMAISVIFDNLKNPYSLVIHSASAYTAKDGSRIVVINYSATNSFGGRVASYIKAVEDIERLYYPDFQVELGTNSYLSVSTFNGTATVGIGDYCNNLDVNTIWNTEVGSFNYYRGL